jgi:fructokinase
VRIGVDLGGTKIEGAVLDAAGKVALRRRIPTPAGDYGQIVARIAEVVLRLERESGTRCTVGVGTPGSENPSTGLMRNCNATIVNGKPLRRDLEAAIGRPVRLENDANCFALSEAVDGAGAGAAVVFGVIVGTGVGGGVVVRGRLISGRNRIAGEWGHSPLPWAGPNELPGPLCHCGRRGCIETFLSGPALARDGGAAPELLASSTDPLARAALDRYIDRLARALVPVIHLLDPDVIVLGGGLSAIDRLYRDVPPLWPMHLFSDAPPTTLLRPAKHGDASGVRGAAWLWHEP